MARPREQYAIREFWEARQALDGYYSALLQMAELMKHGGDITDAIIKVNKAKDRLAGTIDKLGLEEKFTEAAQEGA